MSRDAFLIAAVTARALAASAARAGVDTVGLDLFDDADLASATRRNVCAKTSLRFDSRALMRAAKELAPGLPLVYGAGFEGNSRLLAKLASGRELCGNTPETIALVNTPRSFFSLLDELDIPHPEVSFERVATEFWLAKKTGGAGGWHVRPASRQRTTSGYYFQRRVAGRSLSALFLAAGGRANVIGFNETWTSKDARAPYCYAGAISGAELPECATAAVVEFIDRIVEATRLVGLNGLDFILEDERLAVLEVNARPPATLELYDEDFPAGLFAAHVDACRGKLPSVIPQSKRMRAAAVVYARTPLFVEGVEWPPYAADRPRNGSHMPRGAPVCTVKAEGFDFDRVRREALDRRDLIIDMLYRKAA